MLVDELAASGSWCCRDGPARRLATTLTEKQTNYGVSQIRKTGGEAIWKDQGKQSEAKKIPDLTLRLVFFVPASSVEPTRLPDVAQPLPQGPRP